MKQRNRFLAILTALCCLGSMGSTAVLAQTTTETEPNNTMETAMPIALNTPVSADFRGDADWFCITLPEDGDLIVGVDLELYAGSYPWTVSAYDAQGEILGSYTQKFSPMGTVLVVEALSAGTYYLSVTPETTKSNLSSYHITAKFGEFTPDGDVNSDNLLNAADASRILCEACLMGAGEAYGYQYWEMTMEQGLNADVNQDESIDAIDASIILHYSAAVGAGEDVVLEDFLDVTIG